MSDEEEFVMNEDTLPASYIFATESVDGVLDRGVGICRALQYLKSQDYGIPTQCRIADLMQLVDSVETEGDFVEETYINYFMECLNIFNGEFLDEFEPGDGDERLTLDGDFTKKRLSDLQNTEEEPFMFTFTAFLVSEAEIGDISIIRDFPSLTTISLSSNLITDPSPLCELPKLRELNLSGNRIKKIANLKFQSLEKLDLSSNQIAFIGDIDAPLLKHLDCSQNHIFYIQPRCFAKCGAIETLIMSVNSIRELSEQSLFGLDQLKTLKLDQNMLKDLKNGFYATMKSLNDLDVSDNPLLSLIGVEKLSSLEVLDVHKSAIEDSSTFSMLTTVKYLYIYETPLAEDENHRSYLVRLLPQIEEIDEVAVTEEEVQAAKEAEALAKLMAAEEEEDKGEINIEVGEEEEETK